MKMTFGNKELFYNDISYTPSQESAGDEDTLENGFNHTSIKAKMWTNMWDTWTRLLSYNEVNYTPSKINNGGQIYDAKNKEDAFNDSRTGLKT